MGIRHVALKGVSQQAWMDMLRRKADALEEDNRDLRARLAYADKRERDEIDERIAKNEEILCGMHC
jgi:predicted phage gp36 major capsid-like protein